MRIAIIGDSFVFGVVPREDNFTHVLGTLANRSASDVEILNMGIPAAEPNNYLALVKKDAVLMNVDTIYVVFFVGNDITQSHPDFKTAVWAGSTRELLREPYLVGPSIEYSYLFRTLRSLTRLFRERMDASPRESYTKENFLAIEHQRSDIYKIKNGSYIKKSYEAAIGILVTIAEESESLNKQTNKQITIVLAPDELQVNDELRRFLTKKYDIDIKSYDFLKPQRIIGHELNKAGIQVIDLLPAFRKASKTQTLYIKQDTHWNKLGNRLAAEIIFMHLEKHLVKPGSQ